MTPALRSADSSEPPSPTFMRTNLTRTQSNISTDERTPLLQSAGRSRIRIQSALESGKARLSRGHSFNNGNPPLQVSIPPLKTLGRLIHLVIGSLRSSRHHSRAGSWGQRLVTALTPSESMRESKGSIPGDDRVWYDQFTSTDWVQDSIADAHRVKALRSRTDIRGRILAFFDGTQGWLLSALVGFLTATIAYLVDVSEAPVFDWKEGYCSTGFFISEKVSRYLLFSFLADTKASHFPVRPLRCDNELVL